ncbi:MAG TPA: hypothetical protein VFK05_27280 [Polyangiaceae bacterium]|nr:hypothetical protein [Polyangiaceae bacterium]
MRTLAACLVGVLGLGVLSTLGACSDSTDMGTAGAGGAAAGAAGKAGSTSSAGATSDAGAGGSADQCAFQSEECTKCFIAKCAETGAACYGIPSCADGLDALGTCACAPGNDPNECLATFITENGDPAEKLANCYTLNCEKTCQ